MIEFKILLALLILDFIIQLEPTELYARISENPCYNTYPGDEAFSEVETRNLRDFALSLNGTIKLFIDLHSTSQNNKVC